MADRNTPWSIDGLIQRARAAAGGKRRFTLAGGLLALVVLVAAVWFIAGPAMQSPTGGDDRRTPSPATAEETKGTAEETKGTAEDTKATAEETKATAEETKATAEETKATADHAPPVMAGREEIAEIQRLLAALEFVTGSTDGVPGSRTASAIRLYQQFAGLAVDGIPSRQLLDHLRKTVGDMKDLQQTDGGGGRRSTP